MNITNKTKKPFSVPLPAGKKLFLGPGKTGQVTPKALEHPPVAKLIADGDLEADDTDVKASKTTTGSSGGPGGARHGTSGAMRQSGDR